MFKQNIKIWRSKKCNKTN